jgi:Glycosyltransferase 61
MGVRVVTYRGGLRVVRPIVDYGYNPLPNLGYQTRHPNDLYHMRNVILERFELGRHKKQQNQKQEYTGGGCPVVRDVSAVPVIRILNRRPDHGRTLQNIPELIEALTEQLPGVPVIVLDSFEGKTFEEQVEYMASTDILLSPHGGQLASIPFLPACASVTEFFPVGYYCPQFFASLAAASGGATVKNGSSTNTSDTDADAGPSRSIAYHSLYTGKDRVNETQTWMKDEQSRTLARLFPVCPNVNVVVEHVRQRIQAWHQCCSSTAARM